MKTKSIDKASVEMLSVADEQGIKTAWDRFADQQPQCGFGELGPCCRICNMGPCRITPFDDGPSRGVCGATADIIVARNILRMIAAGAAAHSDHGRDVVEVLEELSVGRAVDYGIKDETKLKGLAMSFGISTEGRSLLEIGKELADAIIAEFGMAKGSIQALARAPQKRRDLWHRLGIEPRGIDREIVEAMHRTHMGVDNDPVNLLLHGLRVSLSDGWGGSMYATQLSDIIFGTPQPVRGECNLGVLREDAVNIIIHGHNPVLAEMLVDAAMDPMQQDAAKNAGATDINLVGMCCSGAELLMRHGLPYAGNMLQAELAIITGCVDAMVVDYQCIMPALSELAACYHTKFITTFEKAKFPGAVHIPLERDHARETAARIITEAVQAFPKRNRAKVHIPTEKASYMAGFSVEAIVGHLGGTPGPLLEAIKDGRIRGLAAIVGCNNPKVKHDFNNVNLARELIKNDILVVETGCVAAACAKAGLMLPEAAGQAGPGLSGVCRALGLPPVLHMGSCVDNTRVLDLAAAVANALEVDISDLPVAAAAPEWYSEKALCIGVYAVASGIFTVLGTVPQIYGSKAVTSLLTDGLKDLVGGYFAIETDPFKEADLIAAHIEAKRAALGI